MLTPPDVQEPASKKETESFGTMIAIGVLGLVLVACLIGCICLQMNRKTERLLTYDQIR